LVRWVIKGIPENKAHRASKALKGIRGIRAILVRA
jgi:hypothetical protein